MKVLLLAGGMGTRLAEETDLVPKPMVEIGGTPILMHIMRHYSYHGFKEFVIALGYKGDLIKRYMLEFHLMNHPVMTIEMESGKVDVDGQTPHADWKVQLVETGLRTMTAGRIRRALPIIGDETFMITYGDGVSDVDLRGLLEYHRSHGKIATLTIVRPKSLFGHMVFDGDRVTEFIEKPQFLGGWVNGGFMVMEPEVAGYLGASDDTALEQEPLERLARDGELMAYRHEGFWQCMDSLKDKRLLEQVWASGKAPWRS